MIEIRRSGNGMKLFDERLNKFAKADIDGALRKAGVEIKDFVEGEVFNTEGSALGKKWAPLKPSYAAWKAKRYPGKGILERTGRMRKLFRAKTRRAGGINTLTISNPELYFPFHQSAAPRKVLPRRPSLKANSKIQQIVKKYIHKLYA